MTTFDFTPLYRTAIGFDRLANALSNSARIESGGYPPYNILSVDENQYRITMAVAGFSEQDLSIVSEQNTLVVSGRLADSDQNSDHEYLYQGIANRAFERRFQLADHVKVTKARLENGLLHIDLARELPEAMKPRQIQINSSTGSRLIDNENAAASATDSDSSTQSKAA
ncbi:MAG: Hsp20 family protein [Gammaproteobacteria bacterium]|nr:Hsp20 family protein [Gammaproteobacteria bacterium]